MKNYLIAMSFFGAVLMPALASAEPVTFGFDAEVIDVDVLAPADLPFSVVNGDILKGRFTFEPVYAEPGPFGVSTMTDTVQEFSFSLSIDSTVVSTSRYSLIVRDNVQAIDGSSLSDIISLSCPSVGGQSCQPGTVPNTENLIWFFSLPILANSSSLSGPDISADPDDWNDSTGYISMTFQDDGIADVLLVNALVTKFFIVPEPSSLSLVMFTFMSISIKQRPPLRTKLFYREYADLAYFQTS